MKPTTSLLHRSEAIHASGVMRLFSLLDLRKQTTREALRATMLLAT
jgi:hypothetical protein